jgi:hypothetical protein
LTLIAQGLTLPRVLRKLQFTTSAGSDEVTARLAMAAAAVQYLQSLPEPDDAQSKAIAHLYDEYGQSTGAPIAEPSRKGGHPPPTANTGLRRDDLSQNRFLGSVVALELSIVAKQRARLIELRDKGEITDDVLRRFQTILDLKESQLDQTRNSWEV